MQLAEQAFAIADSEATAETKYDLIFSEDISGAIRGITHFDCYDPDTSYEEDVAAYITALHKRYDDLKKVEPALRPL